MEDVLLTLPHTQLAALSWPNANPNAQKLIALHGWLDNAASFTQCLPYLEGCHGLAIDLAGHGLSQHRQQGSFYHLWDYVHDIVCVIEQESEKVVLLGHSMGGSVAMLVAAILPDKIEKLVILDSAGPLVDEPEDRVLALSKAIKSLQSRRSSSLKGYHCVSDMVKARMRGFTSLSEGAANVLVRRGAFQNKIGDWYWCHDMALKFPSPFKMDELSVQAFLSAITCPTLLLFAKKGLYKERSVLFKMHTNKVKNSFLIWLPGNHHFHLEPATALAVRHEIQQFIRQNNYEKNN